MRPHRFVHRFPGFVWIDGGNEFKGPVVSDRIKNYFQLFSGRVLGVVSWAISGVSSIRVNQELFSTFFEAGFWAWFAGPGRWGFLAGRGSGPTWLAGRVG